MNKELKLRIKIMPMFVNMENSSEFLCGAISYDKTISKEDSNNSEFIENIKKAFVDSASSGIIEARVLEINGKVYRLQNILVRNEVTAKCDDYNELSLHFVRTIENKKKRGFRLTDIIGDSISLNRETTNNLFDYVSLGEINA